MIMKAYTDATIAKDLLLQFQTYVKTISQRGPTDLTLYSENFAAVLLQIYYGYPFINMNYSEKNIAGIDLLKFCLLFLHLYSQIKKKICCIVNLPSILKLLECKYFSRVRFNNTTSSAYLPLHEVVVIRTFDNV